MKTAFCKLYLKLFNILRIQFYKIKSSFLSTSYKANADVHNENVLQIFSDKILSIVPIYF